MKFIKFNEMLINVNTIVYIGKINGKNERGNQFGVSCLLIIPQFMSGLIKRRKKRSLFRIRNYFKS